MARCWDWTKTRSAVLIAVVMGCALAGVAQAGGAAAMTINAGGQCSTPGALDQSCLVRALANNANIFVPAGTYNITSPVMIPQNNVTITCAPGAVFADQTSGSQQKVFRFTGSNPTVTACSFAGNPSTHQFSLVSVEGAAGAIFRDDTMTNALAYDYPFLLHGTNNALVENLNCPTCLFEVFGPSTGVTLSHGTLRTAVFQSPQKAPRGNDAFTIDGTHFYPTGKGMTAITVQDASHSGMPGSPNVNFTIKGTTATLRGSTPQTAFFACYSIVAPTTVNAVISGNTCNADGEYIEFVLLELGTNHATVTGNNFHAVDTHGQKYKGVIVYGKGNDISHNEMVGWGANAAAIQIYPTANNSGFPSEHADQNTIVGNVLTYPAGSQGGSPTGIVVSCNARGGSTLNTVVRGNSVIATQPGVLKEGLHVEDYTGGACPISGSADENTFVNASVGIVLGQAIFSVGNNSFEGVATPSALKGAAAFADTTFAGGTVAVPSLRVGPVETSTALTRYARYTAVLSPPGIAGNGCTTVAATVAGIQPGDIVLRVLKPSEQQGLYVAGGRASGANSVAIQFCNNTQGAIQPRAGESYTIVVVQ